LSEGHTPAPAFNLEELKQRKLAELKRACKATIEGGFQSSALGVPYTYESDKPQDRENLIGARLAGVDIMYTCIDSQGVKDERLHTASQIQQVFNDGVAHVQSNKSKYWQKYAALEQASSPAEVEA